MCARTETELSPFEMDSFYIVLHFPPVLFYILLVLNCVVPRTFIYFAVNDLHGACPKISPKKTLSTRPVWRFEGPKA